MFEGVLGVIAVVALVVIAIRQNKRIELMERELGALRSLVLGLAAGAVQRPAPAPDPEGAGAATVPPDVPVPAEAPAMAAAAVADASAEPAPAVVEVAPPAGQAPPPADMRPAPKPARPDIETALGTRWAVWVGGIALALGGIFLIRYTIEAGIFGPAVRLSLAGLFGLVLVAAGEFIRRTGFKLPVEGAAGAYVPGILTAAGAFTLFGTVYAAHAVYGFIGPGLAFGLLGIIGMATIAAALIHGQALAGVGLLGAMATPALVASNAPNVWALFVYLAIVLVAAAAVARLRLWSFLMSAAFAGTGIWTLLYLSEAGATSLAVVAFISVVTLAALAFVWHGDHVGEARAEAGGFDLPTAVPGFFVAATALVLFLDVENVPGGIWLAAILLAAMLAVALWRRRAIVLLHVAGAATALAFARIAFTGSFTLRFSGGDLTLDGFPPTATDSGMSWAGLALGLVFLCAGIWSAIRFAASDPQRSVLWAGWGALLPVFLAGSLWFAFGNLDRDLAHAAAALLLAAALAAGAEAVAARENPPLAGGPSVSFLLAGAAAALALMLPMAFGPGLTTILTGLLAALTACATRLRRYPALGWLGVGAAVLTLGRVAFDPTVVGADALGTTPVFNALLPGYGLPALAFGYAAWQLARTTDGRPRLAMEAAAALFGLLTVAMLVRHAMNGGVIDAGAPTLAEQAIYTLIALGAGGILLALDMRSPSSVLRIGSMAAGVVSVACVVLQHYLLLNPLFTDESTGRIVFFNLILLAYLLPAAAAFALAWYARDRRPPWYSAMLALLGATLVFSYANLSLRRLFHGEFIAMWRGMSQLETYAYSALWLAMGVALLAAGVLVRSQVLRLASGALIVIAVAKVFVFDMSELEGVLRALSFIVLGAVLIGIGLFYQRLLVRTAREN